MLPPRLGLSWNWSRKWWRYWLNIAAMTLKQCLGSWAMFLKKDWNRFSKVVSVGRHKFGCRYRPSSWGIWTQGVYLHGVHWLFKSLSAAFCRWCTSVCLLESTSKSETKVFCWKTVENGSLPICQEVHVYWSLVLESVEGRDQQTVLRFDIAGDADSVKRCVKKRSVYVKTFTCGHELWAMTPKYRVWHASGENELLTECGWDLPRRWGEEVRHPEGAWSGITALLWHWKEQA